MPRDGVAAAFSFGKGYGILLGVVATLGIPYTCVTPRTWKSKYLLFADKNASRQRATELFPNCAAFWKLKKHDGLAESALLAHFNCAEQDLDDVVPGDIFELYGIKGNIRVKKRKSKR
jgi:crossover junction endodeoxyribonuclease RuvC